MALSPSPSLSSDDGWTSPSLTLSSTSSLPCSSGLLTPSPHSSSGIFLGTAKTKSDEDKKNCNSFFSRSRRGGFSGLPLFRSGLSLSEGGGYYASKDEAGGGKSRASGRRVKLLAEDFLRKRTRLRMLVGLALVFVGFWFCWTCECRRAICPIQSTDGLAATMESYRCSHLGDSRKFVVMLASNVEGGVMALKGAREWAIERNSVGNKQQYAKRWGYELELVNMMTQKRYSHEWREGWKKADLIRETMDKYPDAEW